MLAFLTIRIWKPKQNKVCKFSNIGFNRQHSARQFFQWWKSDKTSSHIYTPKSVLQSLQFISLRQNMTEHHHCLTVQYSKAHFAWSKYLVNRFFTSIQYSQWVSGSRKKCTQIRKKYKQKQKKKVNATQNTAECRLLQLVKQQNFPKLRLKLKRSTILIRLTHVITVEEDTSMSQRSLVHSFKLKLTILDWLGTLDFWKCER